MKTIRQLAEQLGTTKPTIDKVAKALGVEYIQKGNKFLIDTYGESLIREHFVEYVDATKTKNANANLRKNEKSDFDNRKTENEKPTENANKSQTNANYHKETQKADFSDFMQLHNEQVAEYRELLRDKQATIDNLNATIKELLEQMNTDKLLYAKQTAELNETIQTLASQLAEEQARANQGFFKRLFSKPQKAADESKDEGAE